MTPMDKNNPNVYGDTKETYSELYALTETGNVPAGTYQPTVKPVALTTQDQQVLFNFLQDEVEGLGKGTVNLPSDLANLVIISAEGNYNLVAMPLGDGEYQTLGRIPNIVDYDNETQQAASIMAIGSAWGGVLSKIKPLAKVDDVPPKTNTAGNNGSYYAEADFGTLNQQPKLPSNINTAINDKVRLVDKDTLRPSDVETFRGAEYVTVETTKKATVYRKFGGSDDQAKLHGGFASTTQNANRQQTAVYPKWSNSRFEAEIEIPSGQKLNLGTVGEQPPSSSIPKYRGGADQILLPRNWSSDWVKSVRDGKTGKIYSLQEFQAKFPDQLRRGN
jgi:hypothetical protein